MTEYKIFSLRLPKSLDDKLEEESKVARRSKTAQVQVILEGYFQQVEASESQIERMTS
jgi:predicted DNA-binding protein